MEKTTLYLDGSDYRTLKRIAAGQDRTPASLVREAVAEYIVRHPPVSTPRSIGAFSSGRTDLSERAEERLAGMGRATARNKRTARGRR